MIILQVKDLKKYYGADKIFADISFVIQEKEKVGLVGPNGAGKTTLLRCLTNEEVADSGDILLSQKIRTGYLEQIPEYSPGTTLFDIVLEMFADLFALRNKLRDLEKSMGEKTGRDLEQIMSNYSKITEEYERSGGFSCESTARKILAGLGFREQDFSREVSSLSGGEKTRASLARLLVRQPELLFLDEPTNHLDLEAVEWLEAYLKNYQGALLLISHDRYFLDQVTTTTLELEHNKLKSYPGNYSRYLLLKEEQELAYQKSYEKQQKEIQKTEEYITKYSAGIKAKQARGRKSQLQRLERLDALQESSTINLQSKFKDFRESGNIVLRGHDLTFGYGEKYLFNMINFEITKGEKVALIGGNGVGKSSILKIIMQEIEPWEGQIELGSRVKIGYYDQEQEHLQENNTVLDELLYNFDLTVQEARTKLAGFLFDEDDISKTVRALSGGEKGRLSFLKLMLKNPNFLILDEPTNHLDIPSKTIIEKYLQDYPGTILFVSHDRYFIDNVATRTLDLAEQRVKSYLGNYSYYKEKKAELAAQEAEAKKVKPLITKTNKQEKPKINKAKVREKVAQLEDTIDQMENRKEELSQLLASPETYQNEDEVAILVQEYKILEEKIPKSYDQWEELSSLIQ